MKKSVKTLAIATAACAAMMPLSWADVIVQWGSSGGDTNIVTGNANGTVVANYPGTYVSPANGINGYSTSVAGQTREYYGAIDQAGSVFGVNDTAPGDAIQMVKNFSGAGGTVKSMIAWEQPDFLVSGRALESFTLEFVTRGGTSTAKYLIETAAGWYQSNQTLRDDDLTTINTAIGDLTWSSFSSFGVTGGGATPADTDNIVSVGAYFDSTLASGNWTGAKLQYFQVTAIPEPSSLALFGAGFAMLAILRRRLMRG